MSTKILTLGKNHISCQLADIFNMSFTSGVFRPAHKIDKAAPIHEMDSKLYFSDYCLISLL